MSYVKDGMLSAGTTSAPLVRKVCLLWGLRNVLFLLESTTFHSRQLYHPHAFTSSM